MELKYNVIALILVNIAPSRDIEGREFASVRKYPNEGQYYRVIALILVNLVPSWDIEGRERVLRFPNEGQYWSISVQ